jgi:hypothetical protein
VTGKRFTRLSKIFASALLGAALAATCAAASPGNSGSGRITAARTVGSPAKAAAKVAAAAVGGVFLMGPGDQVAKVLPETVSLQLRAEDSAGGTLSYTATGLPPGVSVSATGLISGTVTAYYDGTVSVTATDAADVSATVSFSWLAENAIHIDPLTIVLSRPGAYAYRWIMAGDPETGEPLTYGATGLPPGLSINPAFGVISGTTTAATGSYDVTVTASDPTGSSASVSFIWRVWNTITVAYTLGTVQAGTAFSVPVTATDSEAGQTFTFSATGLPPGVSINPASGVITGSPTADGVYDVTVTATDSGGSQGSTTGYWTVLDKAAITSPGNLVTTAGQLAQISLKVGDTAANAWLYYAIAGGPPGVYVNWNSATADGWRTATLTGWPAPAGTYKTTISLIGDFNSTASVTFTWTVKPAAGTGPTGPVRLDVDGMCLDDTGNSSANGNKVQIWACNGGAAQNWTYAEDGTLRIHGKCLDATGYGTKVGTKLQLWSCTNRVNQLWTPAYLGQLTGTGSGRCLSDPGDTGRNGTQVELADCPGVATGESTDSAKWTLPAGEILSGVPGKCITDAGSGTANGTKIVLEPCSDSSAQRWTLDPDGTMRIFGKCLSVASYAPGSRAILWSCAAGHVQQWILDPLGGLGTTVTDIDGNSLESPPGATANGTQLVLGADVGRGSGADWHAW